MSIRLCTKSKRNSSKYKQLQDIMILGMEELSEEDKLAVSRARRSTFLISTIPRCRAIYWFERGLVDIKDTIKGFNMIIDGELDHLPESAFNLKGTIEEAIEAGEKCWQKLKQVGSFS
jgi:F-type H+-transporting ATPase subunit beta